MDLEAMELEEELERELKRISVSCLEQEDEGEELPVGASEAFPDELPESILRCLHYAKNRAEHAEKLILEDLEDTDPMISSSYKVVPHHDFNVLAELASEYNEDPEALKKRILAEVAEQDNLDLQLSLCPDPDVNLTLQDRGDMAVKFDYIEVEEKCRKDLQAWEERFKQQEDETRQKLETKKEIEKKEMREEDERRKLWQEEFENERKRLEIVQKQQLVKLEKEEENEKKALAEELKKHQELINHLQKKMEKEKKAFEEQKEKERKILEELQIKAATKIQARYRAFLAYRKYYPKIRERKAENKRKKELELKMDLEKKAAEEKIKRKLEEKKQKEEARKRKEEEERKRFEEIKREECLKLEQRRFEYEKKKEAEKKRYEVEKQMKMEELKKNEENREKEKSAGACVVNTQGKVIDDKSVLKTNTVQEAGKEQEVTQDNPGLEIGIEKNVQERNEMKTRQNNGYDKIQNIKVAHFETEQTIEEQKNNEQPENTVANNLCSVQTQDHNTDIDLEINKHLALLKKHTISSNKSVPETKHSLDVTVMDNQSTSKEVNRCQAFLSEDPTGEAAVSLAPCNSGTEAPKNKYQENYSPLCEKEDYAHLNSVHQLVLPDHIEEKRLSWMKSCIPWSKIFNENQRKKIVKSRPRKCSAANKMPPLNAEIILKAGPWRVLKQVTTVTLEDLPGCSLSTLSECSKLQSLTLRRCGLTALDGLSSCKELKYIDVQENNTQVINCEGLESLCVLLLSNNRLTSIHGLEGCPNLKSLELSGNKITRIGGLDGLRNLQRLIIDHNQLISTKGLEATPALIHLDCSFNHLTELEGIHNCGLLQILKLQGNNLSKPPVLQNQVLLRELYLDDNSVTTLDTICSCWLPVLQILSLSQNSLTQLAPLSAFVSLEKLDISNNCLSDLQNVLTWINGCHRLCELSLNGNPLLQEADWNSFFLKKLPFLKILNDEAVTSGEKALEKRLPLPPSGSFLAFCRAQIQEFNLLNKRHENELGVARSSVDVAKIHCRYFDGLMKLASEHRYAHEYGVLNTNDRFEAEICRDPLQQKSSKSNHHHHHTPPVTEVGNKLRISENCSTLRPGESILKKSSVHSQEKNEDEEKATSRTIQKEDKDSALPCVEKTTVNELVGKSRLGPQQLHGQSSIEHSAAMVIQCHWRGYVVRRDIHFYITLHEAAVVIQTAWRNFCIRRSGTSTWKKGSCSDTATHRHKAATRIQACWKGFYLRKKLSAALAAIALDELDEDFEEVNLDDFTYDEASLEKEWLALDDSRFPSKTLLLSNQLHRPKNPVLTPASMPPILPWHPHQAWQCDDVSKARTTFTPDRKEYGSSSETSLSRRSELKPHHESILKPGKEEIVSEEWGFKDVTTAQLMLRRAQKMKSKQAKNRKLLDPAVRLALFRNSENKHAPVKPPRKIQPARVEYFRGREEEFGCSDTVPSEKPDRSRELTYQWLHTQCGDHETARSRIMKCNRFLPELDPEILNGGRVQLVAGLGSREAADLDLVSVSSGSAVTQPRERSSQTHRHAAGSATGDTPASVKTNGSAVRKERISFRDNPVHLSGGWGGGKKREKTFK